MDLGLNVFPGLRHALERHVGDQSAPVLQEAGYLGAEEVHRLLGSWLSDSYGVDDPADLDSSALNEVLSAFFREMGWGRLDLTQISPAALAIDSPDWVESEPGASAGVPSCNFTVGLLAALLGKLAGDQVAVMEVECRTRGDSRCRFLAGAPETLQAIYEGMLAGRSYQATLS